MKDYQEVLTYLNDELDKDYRLVFEASSDLSFFVPIIDTSERAHYVVFSPPYGILEFARKGILKLRLLHYDPRRNKIYRVDDIGQTPLSLLLNLKSIKQVVSKYVDSLNNNVLKQFLNLEELCSDYVDEILKRAKNRKNIYSLNIDLGIVSILTKFITMLKILL